MVRAGVRPSRLIFVAFSGMSQVDTHTPADCPQQDSPRVHNWPLSGSSTMAFCLLAVPKQKEVRHNSDGVRAWQTQRIRMEYIQKGKIHNLKPLLCPLILRNLLKARYPHWEQGSPSQSYQHSVRLNQIRLLPQAPEDTLSYGFATTILQTYQS